MVKHLCLFKETTFIFHAKLHLIAVNIDMESKILFFTEMSGLRKERLPDRAVEHEAWRGPAVFNFTYYLSLIPYQLSKEPN